jgi:hypothetical protein
MAKALEKVPVRIAGQLLPYCWELRAD